MTRRFWHGEFGKQVVAMISLGWLLLTLGNLLIASQSLYNLCSPEGRAGDFWTTLD